jgi:hypothetical protein
MTSKIRTEIKGDHVKDGKGDGIASKPTNKI